MKLIKKHFKLIIFVLVVLLIYFIYQVTNNNNINYVALGDDFSLGKNSYGVIDYGYSDLLKDELKAKDKLKLYTKKFSQSNMMIRNLYEDIITNKEIVENNTIINLKQTLREASIVTLSIGINDLIYKISLENDYISNSKLNKMVADTYNDFEVLIKEIHKYFPHKIYVIGNYKTNMNDSLNKAIIKLNNKYKENNDIIFIDIENIFKKNSTYLSNPNSFYPNIDGYKAIYNEIMRNLQK